MSRPVVCNYCGNFVQSQRQRRLAALDPQAGGNDHDKEHPVLRRVEPIQQGET